MGAGATAAICVGVVAIGGLLIYTVAKQARPPVTAVVQAPNAAVAGIQALGNMASHAIDAYITAKMTKDDSDE